MANKEYLVDYDKGIEQIKDKILKSEISKRNKKIIFDFIDEYAITKNLAKPSVKKHLQNLYELALELGKDFDRVMNNKKEIIKLMDRLQKKKVGLKKDRNYSESSIYDFKKELKVFYKWLYNKDDAYPECVRWIKLSNAPSKTRMPETILSREEILKLVNACHTVRDKAMLYSIYESGCRIGEFLNLQIKHLSFDDYGCFFILPGGKTGQRRVRMVESTQHLAQWLNSHPLKESSSAHLWVNRIKETKYKRLEYQTFLANLRAISKRAGIEKGVNPHAFRHARATHLSKLMTEQELKVFFGWSGDSAMVKKYTHLSGKDIDDKMLLINGIKTEGIEREDATKPRTCLRCKKVNSALSKYCGVCGAVLDLKTAIQFDEKTQLAHEILNELTKDTEINKIIAKKIATSHLKKKIAEMYETQENGL